MRKQNFVIAVEHVATSHGNGELRRSNRQRKKYNKLSLYALSEILLATRIFSSSLTEILLFCGLIQYYQS